MGSNTQEMMEVEEQTQEVEVVSPAVAVVVEHQKEQEDQKERLPSVVKSHLPPHLQPMHPKANRKPLESTTDVNAGRGSDGTHVSTPAIVKRRQLNKWFNSPTDAFLSPCTQKLMKPKHDIPVGPLNLGSDENSEQNQI